MRSDSEQRGPMHTLNAIGEKVMGIGAEHKEVDQQCVLAEGGNHPYQGIEQQKCSEAQQVDEQTTGKDGSTIGFSIHAESQDGLVDT